jgi:hypothetical protein
MTPTIMTATTSRTASAVTGDKKIALGNMTSKAAKQVPNPRVRPKTRLE